ncbi:MAG: TraB/GumN family protein [Kordiimonadaceae bacterium]|nr:TraB/GumN family protein [Kordiimonadaceae bacterium]
MPTFSTLKNAFFAFSFIILCVSAPSATPVWAEKKPSPAIWKLTDHDSEIWLFGTVHILNPALKWRSKKIDTAFAKAQKVYFEAPANASTMQALIREHGLNKHRPLNTKMSAKGKSNLTEAVVSLGLPLNRIQQLEPMRPWLAGLTMAAAQLAAQGGDPNYGVERILSAEAKSQGKAVGYLESDADQIQFLSGLSEKAEIFFLEDGLRAIIEEPDLLQDLISSWASGDVKGVDAAMVHSLQGHQELYAALLVNRNKKWAAQIKTILDGSGTVFIAVGAAHLAGGNSVQYYLGDYGLSPQRH